ncbi:hypothetical protein Dimus_034403 [Dionaea muscipula]
MMNLQANWISDVGGRAKPLQRLRFPFPPPMVNLGDLNRYMRAPRHSTRSIQNPCLFLHTIHSSSKMIPAESKKTIIMCSTSFPENTVGIIGGVSVLSTITFLQKLVRLSSREGEDHSCLPPPFILSSDPSIRRPPAPLDTQVSMSMSMSMIDKDFLIENLRCKREFLEKSGAGCIVMPCQVSHAWHKEISQGCSLPFLHVGDCVAKELKEANMKPIEAGSNVKIGLVTRDETLDAGFYIQSLQNQGFNVVLPDRATMEHVIHPAEEALRRKDVEGARNLLRVAIHVLLVRAASTVILASDELQDLLPDDDPLIKKCISPMDALARSTLAWGKEAAAPTIIQTSYC